MSIKPKIAVVIPTYNEKENLLTTPDTVLKVLNKLKDFEKIKKDSFILFVDDGSDDESNIMLKNLKKKHKDIFFILLDKNYGHQTALIAGMDFSYNKSDAMVTIDCDLQQDVNTIEKFVNSYKKGNQIVLGVRKDRSKDNLFKSITANVYHFIITTMGIKYMKGHADFRLVDSKCYMELQRLIWANQFLRSVFTNTNYKTDIQYHDVSIRSIGTSKYSFSKMIKLALEGIFTNSLLTLKFFGFVGLGISILSVFLIIYVFITKLFFSPAPGWSSIFLIICFFGGVLVFTQTLLSEAILRLINQFLGEKPYRIKLEK